MNLPMTRIKVKSERGWNALSLPLGQNSTKALKKKKRGGTGFRRSGSCAPDLGVERPKQAENTSVGLKAATVSRRREKNREKRLRSREQLRATVTRDLDRESEGKQIKKK